MKNHSFRYLLCILITLSFIISTGCSEKDGSGYLFKYSLSADPKNLDPQLAADTPAMTVMGNIYSGLLKFADNGKLTEAVATDYTISSDGLTYTFNLRQDNYWSGSDSDFKEQVTSKDFVFAFRRIFDKNTSSPYAKDFICIKNADKVLSGELDTSSLGVRADGDFKLIFELDYANADFLSLLTIPAASPCNEEFFSGTKGKYGLDSDFIICNGPFYVKQWEYDYYGKNNYLIMRKNKYYSETEKIYPSSLNFFIQKDNDKIYSDFTSGVTDCVVIDGSQKNALNGKYSFNEYETSSLGLFFNNQSEIFKNKAFREALALSINRDGYKKEYPKGLSPAYAIVPKGITMLNKSYRELAAEADKSVYDPIKAKESWNKGLSDLSIATVEAQKILISEKFVNSEFLKNVTQQWQNELNFYCGIEVVSDKEYYDRINSGEYDIALYELTGNFNNPRSILKNFMTGNENNIFGYSNSGVDALLNKSERSQNLSDSVNYFSQTESMIISDYAYIPLFYKKEYMLYDEDVSDIDYNPFTKQVYFINSKNFD